MDLAAAGNLSAHAAAIPLIPQSITAAGWADSLRCLTSKVRAAGGNPSGAIVNSTPLSARELQELGRELRISIRVDSTLDMGDVLYLGDRMPL